MPKVYTQFNRPKTIPTNPGDGYLDEFQEQITKKGEKELVKIGEKDIYAMIQVDLEGTKIENILHAMAMGDLSALQQREATYYDATQMPKNLMEVENLVLKAKYEFEQMPSEVREKFDNNPDKYIMEMGSKEWIEKMAPYNDKIAKMTDAKNAADYKNRVAAQAKFESDVARAKEVTE